MFGRGKNYMVKETTYITNRKKEKDDERTAKSI